MLSILSLNILAFLFGLVFVFVLFKNVISKDEMMVKNFQPDVSPNFPRDDGYSDVVSIKHII